MDVSFQGIRNDVGDIVALAPIYGTTRAKRTTTTEWRRTTHSSPVRSANVRINKVDVAIEILIYITKRSWSGNFTSDTLGTKLGRGRRIFYEKDDFYE